MAGTGMQEWKILIVRNLIILLPPLHQKKSHLNLLFSSALIMWLLFLTNWCHTLTNFSFCICTPFSFLFFFNFLQSNLKKKDHFIPPVRRTQAAAFSGDI